MISKIFKLKSNKTQRRLTLRDLIEMESTVGGKLFGAHGPKETVKFYNLDLHNWYFYQEIVDRFGRSQSTTMHYEVRSNVIVRATLGSDRLFEPLAGEEYGNFIKATELYYKYIMKQVYGHDLAVGKKLQ